MPVPSQLISMYSIAYVSTVMAWQKVKKGMVSMVYAWHSALYNASLAAKRAAKRSAVLARNLKDNNQFLQG